MPVPGRAAAEDHDLLVGHPAAARPRTPDSTHGQADRRRSLDVIVERAQRVAVALEDAARPEARKKSSQCRIALGKCALAA